MRLALLALLLLTSCNNQFIARSPSGHLIAYQGSGLTQADSDEAEITLPDGTRMKRTIVKKDETGAAGALLMTGLAKDGIKAGTKTAGDIVGAIK